MEVCDVCMCVSLLVHVRLHVCACAKIHIQGKAIQYFRKIPHNNKALDMYIRDMGWLRLVGFLKLNGSSAEYRLFYRALLQNRPIILRSLLIVVHL